MLPRDWLAIRGTQMGRVKMQGRRISIGPFFGWKLFFLSEFGYFSWEHHPGVSP